MVFKHTRSLAFGDETDARSGTENPADFAADRRRADQFARDGSAGNGRNSLARGGSNRRDLKTGTAGAAAQNVRAAPATCPRLAGRERSRKANRLIFSERLDNFATTFD